jgi:hypothetical protein
MILIFLFFSLSLLGRFLLCFFQLLYFFIQLLLEVVVFGGLGLCHFLEGG